MTYHIFTKSRSHLKGWSDQDRPGLLHRRRSVPAIAHSERHCCRQRRKREEWSVGSPSPGESDQRNTRCPRSWNFYRVDGTRGHEIWRKGWPKTSGMLLWDARWDGHRQKSAQQNSSGFERTPTPLSIDPDLYRHHLNATFEDTPNASLILSWPDCP